MNEALSRMIALGLFFNCRLGQYSGTTFLLCISGGGIATCA